MNQPEQIPDSLKSLVDDYLDGLLDEARIRQLEEHLFREPAARHYFVRYGRLQLDLHRELRAHFGVVLYRNGRYAEALTSLEKSLAAGQWQPHLRSKFFLAMCHARLGDPVKAQDYYE